MFATSQWRRLVPTSWEIIPNAWSALTVYLQFQIPPDGYPFNPLQQLTYFGLIFILSSTGKKIAMAITGFVGMVYVITHMLGNLQAFAGPIKLNSYAALLKSNAKLLWAVRIVLLATVVLHTVAAYQLAKASWKSRPIGYVHWRPVASTYASHAMTRQAECVR
jgi:hypothetical protein